MSENTHQLEAFERPSTERVQYQLLVGHQRTDGTFKTSEQLRSEYVELTDEVIRLMVNGVETKDKVTGETRTDRPDVVVWLDKSARPVSWLTRKLWPTLAADSEGTVPNMPLFRYVNIDRDQWVNTLDPNGTGEVDIDRVDQSIIRSLRSIFLEPGEGGNSLTEDMDRMPTELDDKTVLIIDEVYATGRTLKIAKQFFERAFPEARIAATHWMKGVTALDGGRAIGNADLPVWYKEKTSAGRGVGNRNERVSQDSYSRTQRLGAWFLSTLPEKNDHLSRQLRQEIDQLGKDVANGELLIIPSLRRDEADFEERATRLNGMTFDEFIVAKRSVASQVQ